MFKFGSVVLLAGMLSACISNTGIGRGPIELGSHAQAVFEHYNESRYPIAFAVTTDGEKGFFYYCDGASCLNTPLNEVNNQCSSRHGKPCRVYARGRQVVWKFNQQP